MKKLLILFFCFTTVACVTGYNPNYFYNQVQVVNLSGGSINTVQLRLGEPGRTLSCEEVSKNAICDERFGKRYRQQVIELSWTHTDGEQKSESIAPQVPVYYNSAFPLRVVMEIRKDGSVKSFFEQDEPGRDSIFLSTNLL